MYPVIISSSSDVGPFVSLFMFSLFVSPTDSLLSLTVPPSNIQPRAGRASSVRLLNSSVSQTCTFCLKSRVRKYCQRIIDVNVRWYMCWMDGWTSGRMERKGCETLKISLLMVCATIQSNLCKF